MKNEIRESVVLENEGQKIFGILHRPKNAIKKSPAILFCHGFAGQKTGRYRLYVSLAEELAKNGIIVLRIDFRGCGDSEGEFSETCFSGEVSDALKGLNFLKDLNEVDQNRIGIYGRSLGGAVALVAAKEFQFIKSVALWAPMFSPDSWQEKWDSFNKDRLTLEEKQELMVIEGQPIGFQFLKELFDLRLHDDLQSLNHVPLFHITGKKDKVVTLDQKEKYRLSRDQAKANTRFLLLENSDHEFSDVKERIHALNETVNWFKETL